MTPTEPIFQSAIFSSPKVPFLELNREELTAMLQERGMPKFRAAQLRRWVFARKTETLAPMTDIAKRDRAALAELFSGGDETQSLFTGRLVAKTGASDRTEKILIEWPDRHRVEAVLLRDDREHRTGCISTQVGCAMGCAFCASGLDGFARNLTRGEILEQMLRLNQLLPRDERLTHLVIMGTGEPTLNLGALLPALAEATASDGLDIGNRKVTISTVGLPDGIDRLTAARPPYKLAVSLHAPDDETRNRIIPQNRHSGITKILAAADRYFQAVGRRVTFEYILIAGVNDSAEQALQLARLLDHKTAIVNIIPYNPVTELSWQQPSRRAVERFVAALEGAGIQVKVRFRKGDDIDAACGQLRRRESREH